MEVEIAKKVLSGENVLLDAVQNLYCPAGTNARGASIDHGLCSCRVSYATSCLDAHVVAGTVGHVAAASGRQMPLPA